MMNRPVWKWAPCLVAGTLLLPQQVRAHDLVQTSDPGHVPQSVAATYAPPGVIVQTPGLPPFYAEPIVPHRHHLILGATAAPFITFDIHDGWKPYIGVSLLPELRYAYSLDEKADTPRVYAAVRWTAFSTSVPFQNNVAAQPVSQLELMGAIGFSFRISRSLETRDRMTTSVGWLSVGLGFGNLKSRTGELITGPSLLLSLDTDGLSFNIGGSR